MFFKRYIEYFKKGDEVGYKTKNKKHRKYTKWKNINIQQIGQMEKC